MIKSFILGETFPKFTRETVSMKFLYKNFSYKYNGKEPAYRVYDELIIPSGTYLGKNNSKIVTTIGRYIINLLLYSHMYDEIGFIDDKSIEGFDSKFLSKIMNMIVEKYKEDKVKFEDVMESLMGYRMFFNIAPLLSPSLNLELLTPDPEIMKEKERLFEKHSDEIEKGNLAIAEEIELALIDKFTEKHKDTKAMDIFKSGAKGNIRDNLKNIAIMKGPTKNPDGSYTIVKDNLVDGVSSKYHHINGQSLVYAAYAKGVNTQVGGALTKKFLAMFSTLLLDKKGSDCSTSRTIDVIITDSNKDKYIDRKIKVGNKVVTITNDNISNYINKTVKLFSVLFCNSENKICNKCAGDSYYDLNIDKIGTTTVKPSNDVMNKSMKKFHVTTIELYHLDNINEFIY